MERPRSSNLIALDLLRFGCALMVLAFHWGNGFVHFPPPGGRALLESMPVDVGLSPFVNSGWIGVELFFVVSGFVIAWSAEASSAASFATRRFLRLVPCAWLCASITAAALLALSALPAKVVIVQWAGSVLFWPMFGIDPSYWTLAIEVNFYLIVALTLIGGATLERIARVGMLLGLASAAYWIAWCFVGVPSASDRLFQLTLLPHGCFFAIGVLIRTGQRRGWRPLAVACLVPIGIGALIEIDAHRIVMNGDGPAHVPPMLLFGLCLLPIVFAGKLQDPLARRISPSLSMTIGLMTYPLYLLHQELGAVLIGGMLRLGLTFWPAAAIALAIVLALAWTIVRFGEPQVRALLKGFANPRTARPALG